MAAPGWEDLASKYGEMRIVHSLANLVTVEKEFQDPVYDDI